MERRKNDAPATPEPEGESRPGAKGGPTPKRREAQAQNKRPLVASDRKAARRADRERRNELYARQQQAMATGDERYLPQRDKGPVRRWVRNYIDSRRSPSEFFLPMAMVAIVLLLFASQLPEVAVVGLVVMYAGFFIALAFAIGYTVAAMRKVKRRFDEDQIPRFTAMYAFTRVFQPRFLRAPKPQVKRGESVE
ncbi:DUF3043 domain-containing protein [Georgenia faecalis]|uniref:DUF3043 domain-containing protein n=1 Tax=Georgenia faecalis TaxID=2483799 RepID=A0ABV9DCH7_9MICO|nr:DUF3043 domain-containing protein [Georgenia faecalis]